MQLLNSPFGHAWRESVKFALRTPILTRQALLSSTFYLPELSVQRALLRCQREISSIAGQLYELRHSFGRRAEAAGKFQDELRQMHREDRFEDWV